MNFIFQNDLNNKYLLLFQDLHKIYLSDLKSYWLKLSIIPKCEDHS
jgi:hypothetical protein